MAKKGQNIYGLLPKEVIVNLSDISKAISRYSRGTKSYKHVVSAMKKLARFNKRQDISDSLEDV